MPGQVEEMEKGQSRHPPPHAVPQRHPFPLRWSPEMPLPWPSLLVAWSACCVLATARLRCVPQSRLMCRCLVVLRSHFCIWECRRHKVIGPNDWWGQDLWRHMTFCDVLIPSPNLLSANNKTYLCRSPFFTRYVCCSRNRLLIFCCFPASFLLFYYIRKCILLMYTIIGFVYSIE